MKTVTAGQMQEIDRKTIMDIGIPGIVLMENAGRGTFLQLKKHFPDIRKKASVICGKGNNGGDGFVIARHLLNDGFDVKVYLLSSLEGLKGDALANSKIYLNLNGLIKEIDSEDQWKNEETALAHSGIIIDAMLGTGLSSEVRGLYRHVINRVNALSHVPVLAVDIPSGIDATDGRILGTAIEADLTCTFGLPKLGHILLPGSSHTGRLEIVDIGIPQAVVKDAGLKISISEEKELKGLIPRRAENTHKGTFGHVFILAGSPGKTGAAVMAARAAMRTGAGLVTVGIPQSLNSILETKLTEEMTQPLPDVSGGFLGPVSLETILEAMKDKTVSAIGPGISVQSETVKLLHELLNRLEIPLVIDADGLNIIAEKPEILKKIKVPVILTPHPGELARLMKTSTTDIQGNRLGAATEFAQQFGVTVVLKGAKTIIASRDGDAYINTTGNPGMAGAGMGDVLTGIISALLAQGLSHIDACRLGVFVHGRIADLIAENRHSTGILATDIIDKIPETLKGFIR